MFQYILKKLFCLCAAFVVMVTASVAVSTIVHACDYMEGPDGEIITDGRDAEVGKVYVCRKFKKD